MAIGKRGLEASLPACWHSIDEATGMLSRVEREVGPDTDEDGQKRVREKRGHGRNSCSNDWEKMERTTVGVKQALTEISFELDVDASGKTSEGRG